MFGFNIVKKTSNLKKQMPWLWCGGCCFTRCGSYMLSFSDTPESPLGIVVVFASIPWGIYRNAHSYSCLIGYFPHRFNFT